LRAVPAKAHAPVRAANDVARDELSRREGAEQDAAPDLALRERGALLGLFALREIPALRDNEDDAGRSVGEVYVRLARAAVRVDARADRDETNALDSRLRRFVGAHNEARGQLASGRDGARARSQLREERRDDRRSIAGASLLIGVEAGLEVVED